MAFEVKTLHICEFQLRLKPVRVLWGRYFKGIAVSRRIYVTVPDFVGTVLDKVAASEGNKPTTLAAFWLETRARELLDTGKVSLNDADGEFRNTSETNNLMQNYLKMLASGSPVSDDVIQLLANETDLTEEELRGIRDRLSSNK